MIVGLKVDSPVFSFLPFKTLMPYVPSSRHQGLHLAVMESGVATTSANSLRTWLHLIRFHRLKHVRVPQMVTNMNLLLQWDRLGTSIPCLVVHSLERCAIDIPSEN